MGMGAGDHGQPAPGWLRDDSDGSEMARIDGSARD